jgi:hypothetical protein
MDLLKTFNNLFDLSYLDGKPKEPERSIEQELEGRCRSIAEEITDGLKNCDPDIFNRWHDEGQPEDFQPDAWDYIEDMLDINYVVGRDREYLGAQITVGWGGPNIYIHTRSCTVKGYWGSDQAQWGYVDSIGLDDVCEELYNNIW